MNETTLYPPIKAFLERQGYTVKAEVGAADIVAVRGDEPPLVVELKTGFSLSLFHQATARQAITDFVYIAVPNGKGAAFKRSLHKNLTLCRRLGIGLITVRLRDEYVVAHLDPGRYQPRQSKVRKALLLAEFYNRVGDPNVGGATRRGLVTAYRQDALRCARYLLEHGATKAALVARACSVVNARRIMADNHYGWFRRIETGIYDVRPETASALSPYACVPTPSAEKIQAD